MLNKIFEKYSSLSYGLKAGLWFTFCNLFQKGIGFVTMPIFTRIMHQNDYGLYSTYLSWYNFILIFSSLNLSYYVFSKGMVKYESDRDKFVLSMQSLSLTTTIVVFLFYILFRNTINSFLGFSSSIMFCMFVQLLFEPSISFWTARNRFEYNYIRVLIVTVVMSLLNPILGVVMVKAATDDLLARVLAATIITSIIGCSLLIYQLIKAHGVFSIKYWKYALGFNLPLIPHFLSSTILSQADRVMINDIIGSKETAFYSVAYSVGMVTLLFSQSIQQALLPWQYTKIKKEDYDGLKAVSSLTVAILAALSLMFIAFGPEIMIIAAPKAYNKAIWAIPPICISVFFMYLFNLFANIEYYFEETKYVAFASIIAAVANIVLNWLLLPRFGFISAGYTTLLCYLMLAIGHYICMKWICKKHSFTYSVYDINAIFLIAVLFLLLAFIVTLFYNSIIPRYVLVVVIIGVCVYYRDIIQTSFSSMLKNKDK